MISSDVEKRGLMQSDAFEKAGITILQIAALSSFILMVIRALSQDIEATVTVCAKAWKRLVRMLREEDSFKVD